jgi:hypothetical protein
MGKHVAWVSTAIFAAAAGCGASTDLDTSGGPGPRGVAGAAASYDACAGPGECVLLPTPDCCGLCGQQTLAGSVAIQRADMAAFYDAFYATCGDDACPSGPPECPTPGYTTWPDYKLFAYCEASSCVKADVREHALSACTSSDECTLRYGAECCAGCQSHAFDIDPYGDIVAIREDAEPTLEALMCNADFVCDACEPQFPPGVSAVCSSGHCMVEGR